MNMNLDPASSSNEISVSNVETERSMNNNANNAFYNLSNGGTNSAATPKRSKVPLSPLASPPLSARSPSKFNLLKSPSSAARRRLSFDGIETVLNESKSGIYTDEYRKCFDSSLLGSGTIEFDGVVPKADSKSIHQENTTQRTLKRERVSLGGGIMQSQMHSETSTEQLPQTGAALDIEMDEGNEHVTNSSSIFLSASMQSSGVNELILVNTNKEQQQQQQQQILPQQQISLQQQQIQNTENKSNNLFNPIAIDHQVTPIKSACSGRNPIKAKWEEYRERDSTDMDVSPIKPSAFRDIEMDTIEPPALCDQQSSDLSNEQQSVTESIKHLFEPTSYGKDALERLKLALPPQKGRRRKTTERGRKSGRKAKSAAADLESELSQKIADALEIPRYAAIFIYRRSMAWANGNFPHLTLNSCLSRSFICFNLIVEEHPRNEIIISYCEDRLSLSLCDSSYHIIFRALVENATGDEKVFSSFLLLFFFFFFFCLLSSSFFSFFFLFFFFFILFLKININVPLMFSFSSSAFLPFSRSFIEDHTFPPEARPRSRRAAADGSSA